MELQLHLSTLGTFHLVSKVQLNVEPQVRILQIRDPQTESGMATGVIFKQQITCNFLTRYCSTRSLVHDGRQD
jgi:hypothetical protein